MKMKNILISLVMIIIAASFISADWGPISGPGWGPAFETGETECTNGIDDNSNGLIDNEDPDCLAIIYGNVTYEEDDSPVNLARVDFYSDDYFYSSFTDAAGGYYQEVNVTNGSTYDTMAYRGMFGPERYNDVFFNFSTIYFMNFALTESSNDCELDCTRAGSDVCDSSCIGYNGCQDPIGYGGVVAACDGHTTTHTINYGADKVRCCTGTPYSTTDKKADVGTGDYEDFNASNAATISRIVIINGLPVQLHVIAYN